ncbi:MAG: FtsK/SpoIIIE domain-containing protein [Oscillospiraceae bacterium]
MASKGQGIHFPHIVLIVEHEYDMKEHAFAQYLPKLPADGKPFENELGMTFIFPKRYREHLPRYCNSVIYFHDDHTAELIPHEDSDKKRIFSFNIPPDWKAQLYNTSKILSSLCYSRISENGKVPSSVSLFELYGFTKGNINIGDFWEERPDGSRINVIETLAVPIGKTESGITQLDLHEDFDGPHMLVAGTTGSGKSETIITYLLGLCLYFRPDEVNLMLVDMKGGGFIKRIGTLPHVVGSVTDVDGDENGTGAEYMLKRFLNALQSEIKRRKILFNSMHVDSINQYIKACRDIDAHIMQINNRKDKDTLTPSEENEIRRQAKENPLAHLILVVDEFTELKRFSTESNDVDFIGEITTIARVGRSLGFHIILISQNIEGAITDDIRVNSKSRLCLKVATRQASTEMIGTDLAASPTMPGHGRAYLLVGSGAKFEYFQSGYAGAVAEENFELPVEIIEASKTGQYVPFYRSEKDNKDVIQRKKQLEAKGRLETQLNAVVGAIKTYFNENKGKYTQPHIIFQKPLPTNLVYEDGRIYEEKDGRYEKIREIPE